MIRCTISLIQTMADTVASTCCGQQAANVSKDRLTT